MVRPGFAGTFDGPSEHPPKFLPSDFSLVSLRRAREAIQLDLHDRAATPCPQVASVKLQGLGRSSLRGLRSPSFGVAANRRFRPIRRLGQVGRSVLIRRPIDLMPSEARTNPHSGIPLVFHALAEHCSAVEALDEFVMLLRKLAGVLLQFRQVHQLPPNGREVLDVPKGQQAPVRFGLHQ